MASLVEFKEMPLMERVSSFAGTGAGWSFASNSINIDILGIQAGIEYSFR